MGLRVTSKTPTNHVISTIIWCYLVTAHFRFGGRTGSLSSNSPTESLFRVWPQNESSFWVWQPTESLFRVWQPDESFRVWRSSGSIISGLAVVEVTPLRFGSRPSPSVWVWQLSKSLRSGLPVQDPPVWEQTRSRTLGLAADRITPFGFGKPEITPFRLADNNSVRVWHPTVTLRSGLAAG